MVENYREMVSLGKYGHIWLVIHDTTGKVCVKKRLEVFNREVYERLEELRHGNIPSIVE